ncbi:hypothetical protein BDZ94DRAFT_1268104 [Collybia nuda]|uniref:Uncharacterized protein n=1 Tax=Collybia nuda TaxID=64659 RepID=A0A9P5XYR4_9AGAR|nr:hypothetical protein BDZ94DRAFT_1268104 [Collybia nuda]
MRNTSPGVATAMKLTSPEADKLTEKPKYESPAAPAISAAFPAYRRVKLRTFIVLGYFVVSRND